MTYDFTVEQLHKMNLVHENKGPHGLYEYVHGKKPETTEVVEDLAIAFYSQFNSKVRYTF